MLAISRCVNGARIPKDSVTHSNNLPFPIVSDEKML